MRVSLLLAALVIAAPAAAAAQDATERRREQAFENLRQMEQNQRIGEIERQVTNLEIRRQSDETLRALQAPVAPSTPIILPGPVSSPPVQAQSRMQQNQRIDEVERRVANLEIRRQSDETLRALQPPPAPPPAAYTVPGSSAATGVSPIQPMGTSPGAALLPEAPLQTAPYAGAGILTAGESVDLSPEDRVRDLELAASNARLREIAAAQRGE